MEKGDRQRIDRWLFFARVVKSRTLAAKLVAAGRVRCNREKVDLPSRQVAPGDVLTITLDRRILVYRLLATGIRRGPAEEARSLYENLSPDEPATRSGANAGPIREPGAGRPTKKDRRAMDRLKDAD